MTALPGWTPVIVKLLVSYANGHQQLNYRWCPNLNLREISESESETQGIHHFTGPVCLPNKHTSSYKGNSCSLILLLAYTFKSSFDYMFKKDLLQVLHPFCYKKAFQFRANRLLVDSMGLHSEEI